MLFAMIIGGLIGYAFGKFPGFLVGAALGAFLLNRMKTRLIGKLQNMQSGFIESVFAVMGWAFTIVLSRCAYAQGRRTPTDWLLPIQSHVPLCPLVVWDPDNFGH